jgi:mRNA-degrading endonuclease RelE of RelBE toxin-antitoxin system
MKLLFSPRFLKQYSDAPMQVQKAFDKQAKLLTGNLRHPGLHSKKFDEARDIWQARVTRDWRFYFTIKGDTYHLHTIVKHPK